MSRWAGNSSPLVPVASVRHVHSREDQVRTFLPQFADEKKRLVGLIPEVLLCTSSSQVPKSSGCPRLLGLSLGVRLLGPLQRIIRFFTPEWVSSPCSEPGCVLA